MPRALPTITAFAASPDRGRGLARDMRVRWALEEVGQPYDVRLVSFAQMKQPAHRALHPFGQIPTYEEGDLALFETGAIVLRIAEARSGLLPEDANARARAIAWTFAALNTVEPPIVEYEQTGSTSVKMKHSGYDWFSPLFCESALGSYSAAVALHGVVHPTVLETSCQCRGEQTCTFVIRWR